MNMPNPWKSTKQLKGNTTRRDGEKTLVEEKVTFSLLGNTCADIKAKNDGLEGQIKTLGNPLAASLSIL